MVFSPEAICRASHAGIAPWPAISAGWSFSPSQATTFPAAGRPMDNPSASSCGTVDGSSADRTNSAAVANSSACKRFIRLRNC
ncbi:hypothetical protein [Amycolatopsis pigmentata]|uniref:Uncharacterized protein n=1 Tax=Amycolatopsis pigmentata TaxID=450801 RepID=A0ABW5G2S9_9PSEU